MILELHTGLSNGFWAVGRSVLAFRVHHRQNDHNTPPERREGGQDVSHAAVRKEWNRSCTPINAQAAWIGGASRSIRRRCLLVNPMATAIVRATRATATGGPNADRGDRNRGRRQDDAGARNCGAIEPAAYRARCHQLAAGLARPGSARSG